MDILDKDGKTALSSTATRVRVAARAHGHSPPSAIMPAPASTNGRLRPRYFAQRSGSRSDSEPMNGFANLWVATHAPSITYTLITHDIPS